MNILGKESALRPSESNKSSEPSTPVSNEDKPIIPAATLNAFHEPDVIASTKCPNIGTVSIETDRPIAPPRRRRRKQNINVSIENNGAKIEDTSNVCTVFSYKINLNCLFIYFILFINTSWPLLKMKLMSIV